MQQTHHRSMKAGAFTPAIPGELAHWEAGDLRAQ